MVKLVEAPSVIAAAGQPPKTISEFVGRVATGSAEVSVAIMESPSGWAEPGQRPDFDEYSIVLEGALHVETEKGDLTVSAGQALHAPAGEWVRYSTPGEAGARYVSVCVPGFTPDTVHRDDMG
jgi:mannose-6-phosphate isomerase-like protein (cupin superfamily)